MTTYASQCDPRIDGLNAEIERLIQIRDVREVVVEKQRAEIERLRAALFWFVQHDNGGPCIQWNGRPCAEPPEKCGCYLEFQEILNEQLGVKGDG